MNILFITDNFYPETNAIASRVYERACYWVQWGHKVTVITSVPNFPEGKMHSGYRNKWYQVQTINGIRVIRVKTFVAANKGFLIRVLDFLSFVIPSFVAGIFEKKSDLVVTTSPQFFGAWSACFVAKCRRVPFVLELGDLWPASIVSVGAMRESFAIRVLEKLELALYRLSDRIIVVSPAFKTNLVNRFVSESKIDIVLNGVDLSRYAPQQPNMNLLKTHGFSENTFIVGYIGTHGMAHGLDNVLDAAALLQDHLNIQFLFVGAGAERKNLIQQAKDMKLKNVTFVPAQPKDRISEYWSLCHLALVHLKNTPTFATAIPSKIFEAMGMGLPILLVTPKGSASDIVEKENVGLWVTPENPKALAEGILQLYHDQLLLSEYAKNSLLRAKDHTREAQARQFLSLLENNV